MMSSDNQQGNEKISAIADCIASNFEAIPDNAEVTYVVSSHPPFICGTVGDLLALIGKPNRPHESGAAK